MAAVTQMSKKSIESDDGNDGPEDRSPATVTGEKTGFFTVYKRGQGAYTRYGTAICVGLLIAVLGRFAYEQTRSFYTDSRTVPSVVTAVVVLLGGILAWRLMNTPRNVNFLISTDSEMKKVNWTSREELFGSTRVVVLFLFAIALVLFLIDVGTGYFFRLIGLLRF